MRLRRAVAVAAAASFVLAACGGDEPELTRPRATSTTADQAAGTTSVLPSGDDGGGGAIDGEDPAAGGTYSTRGDYDDGRHVGKVTSFENSTVGVDVVEFLTGDAAKEAYARDTGSNDSPPNDYYVRNRSTTVRLLPVADNVVIRVNTTGGYPPSAPNEGRRVSTDTFAGYFRSGPVEALFWITIKGGDVVSIEEQYLP